MLWEPFTELLGHAEFGPKDKFTLQLMNQSHVSRSLWVTVAAASRTDNLYVQCESTMSFDCALYRFNLSNFGGKVNQILCTHSLKLREWALLPCCCFFAEQRSKKKAVGCSERLAITPSACKGGVQEKVARKPFDISEGMAPRALYPLLPLAMSLLTSNLFASPPSGGRGRTYTGHWTLFLTTCWLPCHSPLVCRYQQVVPIPFQHF